MANIVILGVYATKTALDTAEKATATNGDTYIVGSKCPYDLYTYSSSKSAFQKGDAVGTVDTLDITVDDVNQDIAVDKLYSMKFKGADGKMLMVRKGLHLGEIHFYRPTEDF